MYTTDDINLDKVRDNVKNSISILDEIILNDDTKYRKILDKLIEANTLLTKVRLLIGR